MLTWDITADWQFDPTLNTEIEVRFVPSASDAVVVELEHRRLDRYGTRRDEMREIFDKGGVGAGARAVRGDRGHIVT